MYTLKKSLGQHFLKDELVCKQIIDALTVDSFSQLVEVGPGGGALTKYLIQLPGISFKAIELDEEKVTYLEKTFPSLQGSIINESVLDTEKPFDGSFTVIGNFPYNISTQILFRIIEWESDVPLVIGMFQKEVAQRAAAPAGNKVYGVLSVLIQYFYDVEYLFEVGEQSFTPPPKVKSAVIRLRRRSERFDVTSVKNFFNLVKTAFMQRRKTLRNSVRGLYEPEVLADSLFDKRPEQLTVEQFAALTFRMRNAIS